MEPFIKIPTCKNGQWVERTIFQTREEFIEFLLPLFKEPGQYDFDSTSELFNEQARRFNKTRIYCSSPKGTAAFNAYWDAERRKCRKGVIFINGDKIWYLPGYYYMFLNFLQIYNKEKKLFGFVDVRDTQLYISLYLLLAEMNYKHASAVKKRQIAWSYLLMAKLVCQIWFEEGPVIKMGASLKDYINHKGEWKFLEEYRSFLNKNTAWTRDFNPGGIGSWEQKVEMTDPETNITVTEGLKGSMTIYSLETDPANGVGGPCTIYYYSEAGIAPTMDQSFEFIRPAFQSGLITTGMFIAGGSVGDLSQCEPLKRFVLNPDDNDMYAVEHKLMDEKGTHGRTALFIPEQYSMPPCIDQYGNSQIEKALELIKEIRASWKKKLRPEQYRHRISQHPTNLKEAFAIRGESVFPLDLVAQQEDRINQKEYPIEYVDLKWEEGKIVSKISDKRPLTEFPVDKKLVDKSGCIVVYERPLEKIDWGTYYASIDPVSEGKTTTSESLCSIYIYRNPIEVTRITKDGPQTYLMQDKIVAAWCGRFDDINKTHALLEILIEWYNAWAIIENNISLFVQYMILKKKQKYLVPKSQIMFLKELQVNNSVFQEYGWRNTGDLFARHLLSYLIEWLKEEIDIVTKTDGEIVKRSYGIERLPDIMALKEMYAYQKGVNVDRLVSLAALIAFAKVQQANRGFSKRLERDTDSKLDKSEKITKLGNSPFRNIGQTGKGNTSRPDRRPFKNFK